MLRDLRTVGDIRPMPFNSCTEGFGEVPQELTHERKNEFSLLMQFWMKIPNISTYMLID